MSDDEPAHHQIARRGIVLQQRERLPAVDAQQLRLLEARRAGDAPRLVLEQRRPSEHFALAQHEAGGAQALVAADQELDAARFEHVEIVGRIAEVVADAAGRPLFLLRERRDRRQRRVGDADEELGGVERALRHDIERVAFDLGRGSSRAAPRRAPSRRRCGCPTATGAGGRSAPSRRRGLRTAAPPGAGTSPDRRSSRRPRWRPAASSRPPSRTGSCHSPELVHAGTRIACPSAPQLNLS